jgi:hypothetical protein
MLNSVYEDISDYWQCLQCIVSNACDADMVMYQYDIYTHTTFILLLHTTYYYQYGDVLIILLHS